MNNAAPIGVFDSGIGGLTVVRELMRQLPNESIIYFGDTARVPYGPKSPDTVVRYSREITEFLRGEGVKAVVVACNTATAHALPTLRAENDLPIVGVIEPGSRAAARATKTKRVGVIGTQGTIRSGAYERAITSVEPGANITALACPLFVPLVEEGWLDTEATRLIAREYLGPIADADVDTLVLGCTHYPLLRDVLANVAHEITGREIAVVDSASAMAQAAREALGSGPNHRTQAGRLDCFATDTSRLDELAPRFLGEPLTGFELVDL